MRLRGREYRRHLLAAAALHDIYTVGDLASAIGVSSGTVQGWWRGAQPQAKTIPKIARVLDLSTEALFSWFYEGGRPPRLSDPDDAEEEERMEAAERAERAERSRHARPAGEASEAPRAPRETSGSGR